MPSTAGSFSSSWQSLVVAIDSGKGPISILLATDTEARSFLAKYNSFKRAVKLGKDQDLLAAITNVVGTRQGLTVTFSLPEDTWDARILEGALAKTLSAKEDKPDA